MWPTVQSVNSYSEITDRKNVFGKKRKLKYWTPAWTLAWVLEHLQCHNGNRQSKQPIFAYQGECIPHNNKP